MSAIRRQVAAADALAGALVTAAERETLGLGDDTAGGALHEASRSTANTRARIPSNPTAVGTATRTE